MELVGACFLFALGVAALWLGAEWLVRGAASLGRSMGISNLVIGLTVVSFTTSAPEFFVSLFAALKGTPGLAIGNVVGSNIANVGLVLGVSALIRSIRPGRTIVFREVPVMLGVTLLAIGLAYHGLSVGRLDGVILLGVLVAFTLLMMRSARDLSEEDHHEAPWRPAKALLFFGLGFVIMLVGANVIQRMGAEIARLLGVSDLIIGLTMVAIGTSLPELAASLVSMVRGHHGLAIGNVVGSNIFNMTFVLGGVALFRPIPFEPVLFRADLPVMMAFSLFMYACVRRGRAIGKLEGVLLLIAYIVAMAWLTLGVHAPSP